MLRLRMRQNVVLAPRSPLLSARARKVGASSAWRWPTGAADAVQDRADASLTWPQSRRLVGAPLRLMMSCHAIAIGRGEVLIR